MTKRLDASHGMVCRLPGERFGYFAWPTVARMDDGTLVVACSGLRTQHICPFGKTVLSVSRDDGAGRESQVASPNDTTEQEEMWQELSAPERMVRL